MTLSTKFSITSLVVILVLLLFLVLLSIISLASLKSTQNQYEMLNFEQVKESLFKGNRLRIIMNFNKMDLYIGGQQLNKPDALSSFDIEIFEYFGKYAAGQNEQAYIATSHSALIIHARYGVIYNYGKVRMYENNNVQVDVVYLDPNSFQTVFEETFNSTLDSGAVYFNNQTPLRQSLFKY